MHKLRFIVCVLGSFIFYPSAYAVDFGSIKGQINHCGQGGKNGMVIYIPGRQFSVITDTTGQFQFDFVPVGQYVIHVRHDNKTFKKNIGVLVNEDKVTDLKIINICDTLLKTNQPGSSFASGSSATRKNTADNDTDQDGFPVARDCNDNDPLIKPGAIDICDGKDNNCNGLIDENEVYVVKNGLGHCKNGVIRIKQCSEGFADCDADPSNGCEINTNNDNGHCGSCTNACSNLEECAQGLC